MRKKLDYTRTGHWKTVRTETLAGGQEDEQVDATANPSHKRAVVKVNANAAVAIAGAANAVALSASAANTVANASANAATASSASREAPADAMEPARNMHERPISPVRQLLDYTRSGRWAVVSEDLARAEKFVRAMEQRARRQTCERAQDSELELLSETGAVALTQPGGAAFLKNSPHAPAVTEEVRALAEATFFGLDVNEIPQEKWPEIAPLFPR